MKNHQISIFGYSTIASLTSLLLAEKGINHCFMVEELPISFQTFANPLTNKKTQLLEKPFISNEVLEKIHFINKYDFQWYNENWEKYLHLSDNYKFPVYAMDNRIRNNCFISCLHKHRDVTFFKCSNILDELKSTKSHINIIGGGKRLSSVFDDLNINIHYQQEVKRTLFLFNIKCSDRMIKKYDCVKMLSISGVGEVVLYPFLHVSGVNTLNLVVNIIDTGAWSNLIQTATREIAYHQILKELSRINIEIAEDLLTCSLLDEKKFFKTQIIPYFKKPLKKKGKKCLLGVGEAIIKVDPITGQGYNSGAVKSQYLVEGIVDSKENLTNLNFENYVSFATRKNEELYHINQTFTQGLNSHSSLVYQKAATNEGLRELIISCFENTSNYFPWLIDATESKRLVN